jgi:RimJ/RimL family protein N-acetyltransferase
VSGSDVLLPKPAPDIFLAAAKRMEMDPQECIVIEDSFHGVTAARAAGMTCIGYANPNSGNQDLRKAAILVEGFDEIDYEFISHLYNYTHTPAIILTSEQFIIRELTDKDIPALYQICRQPKVREFLSDFTDSLETELEKHTAYIQNIYRFYGFGLWGVFLKCNGRLIGRCGIEYKMFEGEEIYELGYLLDKDYQGMGYAKEFVTEVLNYCFTELDIHKVTAVIEKRNIRSIHLAEQIGMTKVSECCRDKHDCYKYEITYHQ